MFFLRCAYKGDFILLFMKNNLMIIENIKSKIYTFRGVQVMLDNDLAELYEVSTKRLNEQVKRNKERFPSNFCFQLSAKEYDDLRSQILILGREILKSQFATSSNESLRFQSGTLDKELLRSQFATSKDNRGGRQYLPYVFTEQGVAMLSGVLKSGTAIQISIQIMNAFVALRKFILKNAEIFSRLNFVERKQLEFEIKTNINFEKVFQAIEDKDIKPQKGIFFDGQVFDAYKFVSDLIRSAKHSIILIDNYIDDSVLTLFNKRNKSVQVTIFTQEISQQFLLDLKKYHTQYPSIEIKEFKQAHDRFLILDHKEVYHFGASLKDLGKKWFAFSKFDKEAFNLLDKLGLE